MKRTAARGLRRPLGFSLVEAMVGLTLGIITVLIITQTFSSFEATKSTTTASSDAQENGLIALEVISQDARNAGIGVGDNAGAWDCSNLVSWRDDGNTSGPITSLSTTSPPLTFNFAPVIITDGGASGSDVVTFRTGQSFLGSIPNYITADMPASSSELNVSRTQGFKDGDLILVTQGTNCTLMQVTQVQAAALKLQHNPGGNPPPAKFNPTVAYQNNNLWPAYTTGAKIYNMGEVVETSYSVNASRDLQLVSASLSSVLQTLVPVRQIVALQAQYGVSNDASDVVECWVSAVAAQTCSFTQPSAATKTENWNAPTAAMIKRIKAVRVLVVARSGKREAAVVTTAVPTMATSPVNATAIAIPGINTLTDWQNYRYKVYESVIPLRNILWANLS